ncbi:hypothetical protein [Azonexus hydrophilus]|uniref:hypothetical protein n=1 Tax=Azonexus hydrophilus TaxID=418702 RepID=UPI00049029F7|nr:hypothetical protein [Azonexus hydrophilus]
MKPFQIGIDANGNPSFAIPFSDHIDVQALDARVAKTVTIPADARFVIFSSTGDFYCRVDGEASLPMADVVDGTGSELNPTIRYIIGVATVSLISPVKCIVTMTYYK